MPKQKKNKKDRKLRQEIEVLRAQLKTPIETSIRPNPLPSSKPVAPKNSTLETIDDSLIKKDIVKTIFLSAVAFATILTLWALDINSF